STLFLLPDTAPSEIYTLSLHDALPICAHGYQRAFRSEDSGRRNDSCAYAARDHPFCSAAGKKRSARGAGIHFDDRRVQHGRLGGDRKSTRLNSSHVSISYAVFCLKKKK